MMFRMITIAWRVGELAERRGWSVRRLAKAAGLDEKTVRNIVAGRATRVDLDTIARLAGALGVAAGALWTVKPDPVQLWQACAGSAGRAAPGELEQVLADGPSELADPGLERALRSP
jgi:transcriptional regulator with XRE-family HTH domain